MSTQNKPRVSGSLAANTLTLPSNFGNTNVNGLQHKDAINLNDEDYFVKLDDLNPTVNGEWENNFNAQYSSVSEAMASILIKNMKERPNFDSVIYEFATVHLDGETSSATTSKNFIKDGEKEQSVKGMSKTGTFSKNFLKDYEEEHVLAIGTRFDRHTAMNINDYADNVIDVPAEKRFNELVRLFHENGVDKKDAQAFLVNQAAFDIMTGNTDRLNNPSNFTIAYNVETDTSRMVNFDYGRSLQVMWSKTSEQNYDVDEYLHEDINDFAAEITHNNDSILKGMRPADTINFLKERGFEPFEIDKTQVKEDLKALNHTIQNSDVPFKKFAAVKIAAFEKSLDSDFSKQFYKDTAPEITDDYLLQQIANIQPNQSADNSYQLH